MTSGIITRYWTREIDHRARDRLDILTDQLHKQNVLLFITNHKTDFCGKI